MTGLFLRQPYPNLASFGQTSGEQLALMDITRDHQTTSISWRTSEGVYGICRSFPTRISSKRRPSRRWPSIHSIQSSM